MGLFGWFNWFGRSKPEYLQKKQDPMWLGDLGCGADHYTVWCRLDNPKTMAAFNFCVICGKKLEILPDTVIFYKGSDMEGQNDNSRI